MKKVIFLFLFTLFLASCENSVDNTDQSENLSEYYGLAMKFHKNITGLTLLEVDSYQQTTDYSCGPSSVITLLRYYKKAGDEQEIIKEMGTSTSCGTTPAQMADWLNQNGFIASWHQYGTLEILRENLANKKPTLVEWSDWGGHWVLVIGYDTRNTSELADDVIIFADPYDHTDDAEDGISWFNAERFYYMWYDALLFGEKYRRIYISADLIQ